MFRPSYRLGRVAGVEVGVHWSVLIIFGLLAWSLSAGRFPTTYPGNPAWAYLLAGFGAAVVFFLGLLAHEVSHAVVAMRNGLPVEGITLWLFGGVARFGGEARSPGADLRIAGVGPLVSLLIGAGFGLVAAALSAAGVTGLLLGAFVWLAAINIVIAAFNAVPAAPLDGGRLLRAALWKWRGDRVWAAVAAARAGRLFGFFLIFMGVWQFLTGSVGALWLALIGWFLVGAAAAEERQAQVGDALSGVCVRDIMSADPVAASAGMSVAEFVDRHLWQAKHSAFPLVEDGRPTGLVTLNRIRALAPDLRAVTPLGAVACASDELAVATPDEPVADVLPRLNRCGDHRALVVSDGRLVGIVTPTDVSRVVQHFALRSRRPPPGEGPLTAEGPTEGATDRGTQGRGFHA